MNTQEKKILKANLKSVLGKKFRVKVYPNGGVRIIKKSTSRLLLVNIEVLFTGDNKA